MKLFHRILVPHDFSPHATRALEIAADLAREHHGRLVVLHVVTPFHPVTGFPEEGVALAPGVDVLGAELRRLEALVRRTLGRNAPPHECKVTLGDPFRRIADAARDVDTIVMGTAGRTGLSRLVIGSVAEKVVRHARVPVLTVRPARGRKA
jgi:nucleotide-binding universal stress UspA family protein